MSLLLFTTLQLRKMPSREFGVHCKPQLMAELWFEIRSADCRAHEREEEMPKTHPGGQPARRAELRGPSPSDPRLSLNSLSTLPSLTSSTFMEAGSFSKFLTSSTEKVKLGAWGSNCSVPVPTPTPGETGSLKGLLLPHHAQASGWRG